jgi:hypothetical protein
MQKLTQRVTLSNFVDRANPLEVFEVDPVKVLVPFYLCSLRL